MIYITFTSGCRTFLAGDGGLKTGDRHGGTGGVECVFTEGRSSARFGRDRARSVKSLGVVFFRSGGDGGQGGAAAGAVGAVVGVEHVGQVSQGGLGEVAAFAVLPLLVALTGRSRSGG